MEIDIQKRVLEANETQADKNRSFFKEQNVFVLNIMSSPGSGKTQLLCKSLNKLMPNVRVGVIVGDICTRNDADRLEITGAKTIQINTDQFGGDCHLSANLILASAKELG
jgi:hydrogenase nickel incorporation protein HypB